jgi:hypothetical protein
VVNHSFKWFLWLVFETKLLEYMRYGNLLCGCISYVLGAVISILSGNSKERQGAYKG